MADEAIGIQFVIGLAKEAGGIIKEGFHRSKRTQLKTCPADLLTEYDKAVEDFVITRIRDKYPSHVFMAEESSHDGQHLTDSPTWIIDPIDGTTNFVHQLPFVCISIAFAVQKDILLGVVYNPIMNELWYAEKSKGAYFRRPNDSEPRLIKTSSKTAIGDALVSSGACAHILRRDQKLDIIDELEKVVSHNFIAVIKAARDIRFIASAALNVCFVACGRTDVYFEFGPREWDIAAGMIILKEAGGSISSVGGQAIDISARNVLCAATEELANSATSILIDFDMIKLHSIID